MNIKKIKLTPLYHVHFYPHFLGGYVMKLDQGLKSQTILRADSALVLWALWMTKQENYNASSSYITIQTIEKMIETACLK